MRKYEIGLYEKAMPELSWPEKLAAAKEAGYDFVEISIDASEEKIGRVCMPQEERRALRERQMPRTADRQEFRKSLHKSQNYCLKKTHKIILR